MASADLGVYRDRIRRAQTEMARQGVDWLMVGPSSDLIYLTGHNAHLSERLNLMMVPQQGDPHFVVPVLESFLLGDRADLFNVHKWEETQDPAGIAAGVIGSVAGQKIAVGDQLWSTFLLRLQGAMTGASWVASGPVLRVLRMAKDGREIELMRAVAHRTDDAFHEFITTSIAGLTEAQAIERLGGLMAARGLPLAFGICASGPNAASPHHHTGDRVIQHGDSVIFDWGGTIEGYYSDITRTVHIGEPSAEFRKVYDIVYAAQQAAFDAMRPGVSCEDLDTVARSIISDAGYGDAFIHRLGHGLGLDLHEEPYLVSGNALPLAPGMVFSDEPGIYLAGRFGVRIEDIVVCTETGADRLNNAVRELVIMS